jgi:hexosaminidase
MSFLAFARALPLCVFVAPMMGFSTNTTPLWEIGYAVVPTPQKVELPGGLVTIDTRWHIDAGGQNAATAERTLVSDLQSFHGLVLTAAPGGPAIRMRIAKGTVTSGGDPEIDRQAYQLRISDEGVEITGNAAPGLFYGVQTFLQLIKRDSSGSLVMPRTSIEDWPRLQLRFLHWDTKHHQDRIETLKRYLDWAARFKVNMIGFELEDEFAYPSHPVIGAPGAFTPQELQEIVNYGLERYIQVVPQIQAPAHFSYVLKHPEFAGLRADGSNYMMCTCDPRTYDLLFSMYDDAIQATKGVDYFFVSTDEVYYAGLCEKCSRSYNPVNRSLEFVDFVQKAHDYLARRGRKMLIWAEFPLLPEHVQLLPRDLIDGEATYNPQEAEHGIRGLAYEAMQGAELLFPDNFRLEAGQRGHLDIAFEDMIHGRYTQGDPIGAYGAAWDDSGLHNETFWLGWSAVARWGWNPGTPGPDQHAAEFMRLYYGPHAVDMVDVYRLMQSQARAWERTWNRIPSKVILTRYGGYFGKGLSTHRTDMTLQAPLINDLPDWFPDPSWADLYQSWISEARTRLVENDRLVEKLQLNLGRVDRNQYNLEVFLTLARLVGHHWRMFLDLEQAENQLKAGQAAALADNTKDAIAQLAATYHAVASLREDGKSLFAGLQATWEKSRFAKGRSVGDRKFVHVFDDVKDHFADRRADLTYMMAPEDSIGLDQWLDELARVIRTYAAMNNAPAPDLSARP